MKDGTEAVQMRGFIGGMDSLVHRQSSSAQVLNHVGQVVLWLSGLWGRTGHDKSLKRVSFVYTSELYACCKGCSSQS